jgi:pyruvate kinase
MSTKIEKYLHKDMNKEEGIKHAYKRTKIVATVGPACNSYEQLLQLVKNGVNVFRLNFSHVDYDVNKRVIDDIRQINQTQPYNISILGDLQGPKLRESICELPDALYRCTSGRKNFVG